MIDPDSTSEVIFENLALLSRNEELIELFRLPPGEESLSVEAESFRFCFLKAVSS